MAKRKKFAKSWNVSTAQSGKATTSQNSKPSTSDETSKTKAAASGDQIPSLPVASAKKTKIMTDKDTVKVTPKPTSIQQHPRKSAAPTVPPFPWLYNPKAVDTNVAVKTVVDNPVADKKAVSQKVFDNKVVDNTTVGNKPVDKKEKALDNKGGEKKGSNEVAACSKVLDKIHSKAKAYPSYMNPAKNRKPHKLIRDPRIFARIQEYLDSRSKKNFVSIPLMAEYLQKKYPEYARKKKSVFAQYVDRAYEIMTESPQPSSGSDESGEGEPDLSPLSDDEDYMKHGNTDKTATRSNSNVKGGIIEITGTDSDLAPDDETLMDYKDTNAVNNMMSNLYRKSPRPGEKKCISEMPSDDKTKNPKLKIMYPSPHVLNRNLQSSGLLGPRRSSSDKYFLDREGSNKPMEKSDRHKTSDHQLANQKPVNWNSRENNIQQFMGNLPSRTSFASFISPDRDPRQNLYRVHLDKDPWHNEHRSESGISKDNIGVSIEPPDSPTSSDQAGTTVVNGDMFFRKNESPDDYRPDGYSVSIVRNSSDSGRKLAHKGDSMKKQPTLTSAAVKGKSPSKKRSKTGSKTSRREDDRDDSPTVSTAGPDFQKSTVTFADVGGNEDNLKEICKLLVHMRHPEVYRQLGVTPPRGFLLHGPPGCGKTLLANAIAGELDLPYIRLASTELVSGVSGESEGKIRELFDKALESAPCVVFIDEIDAIASKRETASKEMERRIVAQLLACMDDLNSNPDTHVLVIGATNRADSLDPALRRAGRFDREICLGIPDEPSRFRILQVLCRTLRLAPDFDFAHLAHNSPGYVGADLMALTREAAMTAVNRVFNELQSCDTNLAMEMDCETRNSKQTEPKCETGDQSRFIPLDCDTDIGANLLTSTQQQRMAENFSGGAELTNSEQERTSAEKDSRVEIQKQSGEASEQTNRKTRPFGKINGRTCEENVHSSLTGDIAVTQDESCINGSQQTCAGDVVTVRHTPAMDVDTCDLTGETGDVTETVTIEKTSELRSVPSNDVHVQHVDTVEVQQSDTLGGNKQTAKVHDADTVTKDTSDVRAERTRETAHSASQSNVSEVNTAATDKDNSLLTLLSWLKECPPLTQDQLKDLYITMEDFKEALGHVQPSAKREGFATIPGVTWDDVGALHEVRDELQLAILAPVRHAAQFRSLGLSRAQGILLAGPPGCGKTLLAKAIANESGINFISVKGPELLNMYVGESERAVRTVFQRARNSAPCVIFFDELDALCPRRSHAGESGSSSRVVNQLLTEMDGLEERKQVFIMAATNRPDIIDPAVMRPGRLDKTLYVGLPSVQDRLDILQCITKNGTKPLLHEDVVLAEIAGHPNCDRYTGADLAAVVREASVIALKGAISNTAVNSGPITVRKRDFETAFRKIRPSVSDKDHLLYKDMKTNFSV